MSKLKLFVFFFLITSVSIYAFQADDSNALLRNLQEKDTMTLRGFQNDFAVFGKVDPNFEVTWDETYAVPSSVCGNFCSCGRADLMNQYRSSLPENLTLNKIKNNEGHEVYEYSFNGIKVFPSALTYSAGNKGFMLAGAFIHNTVIKNRSIYDIATCEKIATEYLHVLSLRMDTISEKVFFNTYNGLKSAYLYKIGAEQPLGDFLIVVDDEDGEVVYCDNLMQFMDGKGSTYMTNPLKCDATVEPFTAITKSGYLQGSWAKIENGNSSASAANSERNEFVYETTDTHFDESHMYFHMTRIHDYFKDTFGYTGMDKQSRAIVHYGNNYDNAFFSPWGGYFAFGDGSKFNDLARESAIAYHEYTHGVTSDIAGLGTSGEAGGMNEGLSDYFGNSIDNDPDIGEYACAKMGKPYLRSCINNSHYPESVQNECHADSLMWSAPLWEVRQAFGREVADSLAHYSRYYINSSSKFADGLKAILKVDDEKFGGIHKEEIVKIFAARGILQNSKVFIERLKEKDIVQKMYGEVATSG
ncbi:MAG: M36 family metallopeptidase [Candidatus Wallbacteria bacterium]|nr:M36 family metallopeptidase [Candidatus Wallbacteria bacterium]